MVAPSLAERDVSHRACRKVKASLPHAMRLQKQLFARRTAMIRNFPSISGTAAFAFAIAVCLLATVEAGKARESTMQTDCTCEAVRFCSSALPRTPAITACTAETTPT
jgi:hypothetical protein